ncbi:MAG: preprotein translocase subunit YajC [Chlamydiia bacterium]|nr:preprotein translocase subunit YajC [Chlamydiia bacterium]
MKKLIPFLSALLVPLLTTPLFADEGGATVRGGFGQTMLMIGIAVVFFYFILWRPEKKRRKKAEEQRNSLKKGDKVTAMGILGTVSKVSENSVILQMVDGAKIEMLKAAISDVKSCEEVEVSS